MRVVLELVLRTTHWSPSRPCQKRPVNNLSQFRRPRLLAIELDFQRPFRRSFVMVGVARRNNPDPPVWDQARLAITLPQEFTGRGPRNGRFAPREERLRRRLARCFRRLPGAAGITCRST